MPIKRLSSVVGFIFMVAGPTVAIADTATKVTMTDDHGRSEAIWIGKSMARMGTGEAGKYLLIQLNGPHIYHVDEAQRTIFEIDRNAMPKEPHGGGLDSRLAKQGEGPEIAGFATDHYRLTVAETRCGDIFVSREAFEISGIKPVYRATLDMAQQAKTMMASFGSIRDADVCENADELFIEDLENYGMLMRSLDKNGNLETEITAINEDVTIDPGTFDLPVGYKRTDMNQQMRMSAEMMRQMPDMKQIQEMGRMSPEARQQAIRQMQNLNPQCKV